MCNVYEFKGASCPKKRGATCPVSVRVVLKASWFGGKRASELSSTGQHDNCHIRYPITNNCSLRLQPQTYLLIDEISDAFAQIKSSNFLYLSRIQ